MNLCANDDFCYSLGNGVSISYLSIKSILNFLNIPLKLGYIFSLEVTEFNAFQNVNGWWTKWCNIEFTDCFFEI